MKIKFISILSLMLVAGIVFAGCGQQVDQSGVVEPAAMEEVTVEELQQSQMDIKEAQDVDSAVDTAVDDIDAAFESFDDSAFNDDFSDLK